MIDIAKLLGAKDDVEKQANETVKFEKELAKVRPVYLDQLYLDSSGQNIIKQFLLISLQCWFSYPSRRSITASGH